MPLSSWNPGSSSSTWWMIMTLSFLTISNTQAFSHPKIGRRAIVTKGRRSLALSNNAQSQSEENGSTTTTVTTQEWPTLENNITWKRRLQSLETATPPPPSNTQPLPLTNIVSSQGMPQDVWQELGSDVTEESSLETKTEAPPSAIWNSDQAAASDQDQDVNETQNLMQQVKDAGIAGVISYAGWELAFWAFSVPVCIAAYKGATGHWPDFSDSEDMRQLGVEAFAFVNFARFAVPLRIGLALSTTPWIRRNIVDRFQLDKSDSDSGREKDHQP
mmetsp:Transcript_15635/g.32352  ORF Transcript_15635/g.32352 Transcript_15635/m.32352 type:complete len:274 (-) Transcript_15635:130-951(-)